MNEQVNRLLQFMRIIDEPTEVHGGQYVVPIEQRATIVTWLTDIRRYRAEELKASDPADTAFQNQLNHQLSYIRAVLLDLADGQIDPHRIVIAGEYELQIVGDILRSEHVGGGSLPEHAHMHFCSRADSAIEILSRIQPGLAQSWRERLKRVREYGT